MLLKNRQHFLYGNLNGMGKKCGDKLVDLVNPLMNGKKVKPNCKSENSGKPVCGYSILQTENMEYAKVVLIGG